jgi:predicted MFS family arabinose efflux permease
VSGLKDSSIGGSGIGATTIDETAASLDLGTLYALSLGTFAVGTEGFMIAALLPTIASSVAVSIQAAGQLVTIFALVYALSSPLLTALTARVPRRKLLILALGGFGLANLLAAAAPGYWSLAGARVLLAFAAGLYVPNANALAGVLAPAHHRGRALGIVNGGITLAIAIGVPLGALVGTHLGWRSTFLGVAVLSVIALVVLAARLPRVIEAAPPASLGARLAVICAPAVLPTLLTTTLWAVGAYTVYTYISPLLTAAAALSASQIALVLVTYGVAALVGVTIGGAGVDRYGSRNVQAVALPVMAISFMGLTVVALLHKPFASLSIVALVIFWAASAWSFFPAQQSRLIGIVGNASIPVILSLNASFMYLGFALGAVLGSVVIGLFGVAWIGLAAALCIIAAMAMSRFARRQR